MSLSGPGSNPDNVASILDGIPKVLERHRVNSMLDIPCGDFAWMRHLPFDGEYIGADIVEGIIAANTERFGSQSRRFAVLDLLIDQLPTVDLVLCRDCMVHLSNRRISQAIRNILATDSRLLLATHFPACARNPDIISGSWRAVNLELAPFNLPAPILSIDEPSSLHAGKTLSLWRLDDIRAAYSRNDG